MALLFCDGFERSTLGSKYDDYGYNAISSADARTGSRSACYACNAKTFVPSASGSTWIMGMAAKLAVGGGSCGMWAYLNVLDGANGQCGVFVNSNGAISIARGGPGGYQQAWVYTTAPSVFRFGQWNYIEAKIVIHSSAGTALVKLNGETVINQTGLNTQARATATWNGFSFDIGGNPGYVDDLVVCDASGSQNNDLLGQVRVVNILPVTDAVDAGSNADFTCNTGTDHGALVDDGITSDDDTTYVYSSTPNHVDSWNFGALGYTGTIKGVMLDVTAKKTESGTRAIQLMTRPASTNRFLTTDRYLGQTNYLHYLGIWELNPEDSAAWEVADVDGSEFGVKVSV